MFILFLRNLYCLIVFSVGERPSRKNGLPIAFTMEDRLLIIALSPRNYKIFTLCLVSYKPSNGSQQRCTPIPNVAGKQAHGCPRAEQSYRDSQQLDQISQVFYLSPSHFPGARSLTRFHTTESLGNSNSLNSCLVTYRP